MDDMARKSEKNKAQKRSTSVAKREPQGKDIAQPNASRMLIPYGPWTDQIFDHWLEPMDFFQHALPARADLLVAQASFPRVDIRETDTEVKVVADIPGIDPKNITIDVDDNEMSISGTMDRKYETADNETPYRYERTTGSFRRRFTLPARVDDDAVKASTKDGVLTITVPKENRRSKVNIEAGE